MPALVLVCMGCLTTSLPAAAIRGKVVAASGDPLPGVSLTLEKSQHQASSNSDGRFTLTGAGPSDDVICATKAGYSVSVFCLLSPEQVPLHEARRKIMPSI